jgi:hypothetical protein
VTNRRNKGEPQYVCREPHPFCAVSLARRLRSQ